MQDKCGGADYDHSSYDRAYGANYWVHAIPPL